MICARSWTSTALGCRHETEAHSHTRRANRQAWRVPRSVTPAHARHHRAHAAERISRSTQEGADVMMPEPDVNTARSWVEWYLASNFGPVFWRDKGDAKGPTQDGWPAETYTIGDYHDGDRVGLPNGREV